MRQGVEIDRLIEEKRDLEDLVEQQNQAIKQVRMNQKENVNSMNNMSVGRYDDQLYAKILQEKENYIMRLETEMGEMRREIEGLKEKVIGYEVMGMSVVSGNNN